GPRDDDRDRRAVAQCCALDRRPSGVPREGISPLRRCGPRAPRSRRSRACGLPRARRRLIAVVEATLFTRQLIFDGGVNGMVFGLVAMCVVLVYRSTRVINFAVANLGLLGAGLMALLAAQYDIPFWIAAAVGLVVGVVYGALIELTVIRRLFT